MSLVHPRLLANAVLGAAMALLAATVVGICCGGCNHNGRPSRAYPAWVSAREARARAAKSHHPSLADEAIPWNSNGTMHTLRFVAATVRRSDYSHDPVVDPTRGRYDFDCSGMVDWVLQRSAPTAALSARARRGPRPLAADFYAVIAAAPATAAPAGWQRVEQVRDAAAGDLLAWLPHPAQRSRSTGHVAFIVTAPVRLPGYDDAYLVRIADSTRVRHADDTRQLRTEDGFGLGTIVLVVDSGDKPVGYGWTATRSPRVRYTSIVIGRPAF